MKFLSKLTSVVAAASMILSLNVMAAEKESVNIFANNYPMSNQAESYILNGRTMVPIYALSETFGWMAFWDDAQKTANIYAGELEIEFEPGSDVMVTYNHDTEEYTNIPIDAPAFIDGDRIMVPLRAIVELFGIEIYWYEDTSSVFVYEPAVEYDYGDGEDFTVDDIIEGLDTDLDMYDDYDFSSPEFDDFPVPTQGVN